MTRSRLTPISAAVSGSWATARMPRPSRVRLHELVEHDHHDDGADDDEDVDVGHLVVDDREHALLGRRISGRPALLRAWPT